LAAQWGTAFEVHDMIAVKGPRGERTLSPSASGRSRYWGILGGHLPLPGSQSSPLFVVRGDYEVIATRPTGVQTLHTRVHADVPIIWRNRERFSELDRSRGGAVTWRSARSATGKLVLILAMNADPGTGALGICACLAEAYSEKFYIPPYALANVPPTPAHPRGFPLNLVMLLELPIAPVNTASPNSVDAVLAFAASISGRTVQFK
jgi:hypothetical protein